jgi:hypothetical protein
MAMSLLLPWSLLWGHAASAAGRPDTLRIVVMTDIDPGYDDSDDMQSVVRLLAYSNEWDIEGLIATKNRSGDRLHPELIRERVEAYGKVRANLMKHASGWPTTQSLLDRVKVGQDGNNMKVVGDGHDSEGSEWIISVVDRVDPRPVWLISWDGLSTPAQALWKVKQTRSPAEVERFVAKIRLYTISEDADCGPWIRKTFPQLLYVWTHKGVRVTWEGMKRGGDPSLVTLDWVQEHVRNDHGPLGALYPKRHVVEGDTPSFLYLMQFTGLCAPMHPDWGGWGGRYRKVNTWWYDTEKGDSGLDEQHARNTVWRWRSAYQNDFAARMDWCVKPFKQANHPPVAAFKGKAGTEPVHLKVKPAENVSLSAAGSSDPDGDGLSYRWYVYPEAGTCGRNVAIRNATSQRASLTAPGDAKVGKTIHVILEVTDDGAPPLTRYGRVVLAVGS